MKEFAVDIQVFVNGQFMVEVDRLGNKPALPLGVQGLPGDMETVEIRIAGGRVRQAGEDLDRSGLA